MYDAYTYKYKKIKLVNLNWMRDSSIFLNKK
jgi:hypothetical protein